MATYIDKLKIGSTTYDLALTPNKGNSTTPVYFDSNGLPQTCSLDNRYYTETEADNRFVNISGDTMTGSLALGAVNNTKY